MPLFCALSPFRASYDWRRLGLRASSGVSAKSLKPDIVSLIPPAEDSFTGPQQKSEDAV
jgi:hypothetical protein